MFPTERTRKWWCITPTSMHPGAVSARRIKQRASFPLLTHESSGISATCHELHRGWRAPIPWHGLCRSSHSRPPTFLKKIKIRMSDIRLRHEVTNGLIVTKGAEGKDVACKMPVFQGADPLGLSLRMFEERKNCLIQGPRCRFAKEEKTLMLQPAKQRCISNALGRLLAA